MLLHFVFGGAGRGCVSFSALWAFQILISLAIFVFFTVVEFHLFATVNSLFLITKFVSKLMSIFSGGLYDIKLGIVNGGD